MELLEKTEKKQAKTVTDGHVRGLKVTQQLAHRLCLPVEIASRTETFEGRIQIAPAPGMDDGHTSYRWRILQQELHELHERWQPQPVRPPAEPIRITRDDRESLRAMLATEEAMTAELMVLDFELARHRIEGELAATWANWRFFDLTRRRASIEGQILQVTTARQWLLDDAPEPLQQERKAAQKALLDAGRPSSPSIGDHPHADYIGHYREQITRAESILANSGDLTTHAKQLAAEEARHVINTLGPQLQRMERAKAEAETRIADVERRMLLA